MTDPAPTEIVCILCPAGCRLRVRGPASSSRGRGAAGESLDVRGAACQRGREYASSEVAEPMRTFTGTVRVIGGERPVVAVKSDRPVPRDALLDVARIAARVVLKAPVGAGDVIVDVSAGGAGTAGGVRLIATASVARV